MDCAQHKGKFYGNLNFISMLMVQMVWSIFYLSKMIFAQTFKHRPLDIRLKTAIVTNSFSWFVHVFICLVTKSCLFMALNSNTRIEICHRICTFHHLWCACHNSDLYRFEILTILLDIEFMEPGSVHVSHFE